MNRPVPSRNLALLFALVGASCLLIALSGMAPAEWGPVPFFAAGLIITPVSVILMLMKQSEVRAMRRLERGEETVAAWRMTPDDWRAFVALNAEWHKQEGVVANSLDLRQASPADGLDIVATPHSVRVGGEFLDLRHLFSVVQSVRWLQTQPPAIEVQGRVQTKSSSFPCALRIPVNPASQKAAIDLHGAWSYRFLLRNAGSGLFRNPVRARNVSLAICALGAALFALPFLMVDLPLSQLLISNLYGPMVALGLIASLLGGMAGLIYHLRDSKKYRAFLQAAGARWTVSPSAWEAFLAFDRVRSAQPDTALNLLSLPRPVPAAGVEIVAREQGLMVGGEMILFSVMATGGKLHPVWLDGPPMCLEIWAVFETSGSSGSCTLRFPVDPAARAAVEQLCAQWSGAVAPGGPAR